MSGDGDFLSRWSRRKLEARKGEVPAEPTPAAAVPPAIPEEPQPPAEPAPLPPVESLNPESDFTAFMRPDVDQGLRSQALKTLFRDPRYNVMDGLDVYIDDYSKPDPLPEGWLEKMTQTARLGAYEPPLETQPAIVEEAAPESIAEAAPEAIAEAVADAGSSEPPALPSPPAEDHPDSETG